MMGHNVVQANLIQETDVQDNAKQDNSLQKPALRVYVLQHVAFEGLGCIADWLTAQQAQVGFTRFFAADPLPALGDIDLLIVLGGPMSVNDEATHQWLSDEKQLIQQAIAAQKPVLGICLGAQLIASVLGSRIYANAQKEIGWFAVEAMPELPADVFTFPAQIQVLHWHGETFDLPRGAVHLAKSAACSIQAFQYQQQVMGLQFHLETTVESAQQMLIHCADELVSGQPYIQDQQQLLEQTTVYAAQVNQLMQQILNYLVRSR